MVATDWAPRILRSVETATWRLFLLDDHPRPDPDPGARSCPPHRSRLSMRASSRSKARDAPRAARLSFEPGPCLSARRGPLQRRIDEESRRQAVVPPAAMLPTRMARGVRCRPDSERLRAAQGRSRRTRDESFTSRSAAPDATERRQHTHEHKKPAYEVPGANTRKTRWARAAFSCQHPLSSSPGRCFSRTLP